MTTQDNNSDRDTSLSDSLNADAAAPEMEAILQAVKSGGKDFNSFAIVETRLTTPGGGTMLLISADQEVVASVNGNPTVGLEVDPTDKLSYMTVLSMRSSELLGTASVAHIIDHYTPGLVSALTLSAPLQSADNVNATVSFDLDSLRFDANTDGGEDGETVCYGVITVPCSREIYLSAAQLQATAGRRAAGILEEVRKAAFNKIGELDPSVSPFAMSPSGEETQTGETQVTQEGFMVGGLADIATRRLQ